MPRDVGFYHLNRESNLDSLEVLLILSVTSLCTFSVASLGLLSVHCPVTASLHLSTCKSTAVDKLVTESACCFTVSDFCPFLRFRPFHLRPEILDRRSFGRSKLFFSLPKPGCNASVAGLPVFGTFLLFSPRKLFHLNVILDREPAGGLDLSADVCREEEVLM